MWIALYIFLCPLQDMGTPWVVLDAALALLAIVLLLPLLGVAVPSVGRVALLLDSSEPLCAVQWQTQITFWPEIGRCCLEARKQLGCLPELAIAEGQELSWRCQTGEGDVLKYRLNDKAYAFCQQQVIW